MAKDQLSPREQKIVDAAKKVFQTYGTRVSLRQIFYRLVGTGVIDKSENQYKGLSGILVKARKLRKIQSDVLEDRTRKFLVGDVGYITPENHFNAWKRAFLNCSDRYSYPKWKDQPELVQVWCEKQALERLFQEVCEEYNIRLGVTRGYPSFTFLQEANRIINSENKPVTILYFGDWDPSGLDIDRHIRDEFGDFFVSDVDVERIAITEEQISEYSLISAPAKRSDARSGRFIEEHGEEVYELAAFEPDVLQDIIRRAIEEHIDMDIWNEHEDKEEALKSEIRKLIEDSGISNGDE